MGMTGSNSGVAVIKKMKVFKKPKISRQSTSNEMASFNSNNLTRNRNLAAPAAGGAQLS